MTTILIIDDEPGVRDLLNDALTGAGYRVESATNGADGLDQLRRRSADLCIVDINMPTMNGFEFLEKLRAHDTEDARLDVDGARLFPRRRTWAARGRRRLREEAL